MTGREKEQANRKCRNIKELTPKKYTSLFLSLCCLLTWWKSYLL